MLVNTTFSNIFPILNTLPAMIPIFLREHKNGMYRVINFYMSKFLIDVRFVFNSFEVSYLITIDFFLCYQLPKYIIKPALFATVIYWMVGLNSDPLRFLVCVAVVVIVALVTTGFGKFKSA